MMKYLLLISVLLSCTGLQGFTQPQAGKAGYAIPEKLPLHTVPARVKKDLPFVFMISGDGGWTSFDQSLAGSLADQGLNVAGLDAQKYFWDKKTPEGTAADLVNAISSYQEKFGNQEFVLLGYSFGASVVPFVASRLPAGMKGSLKGLIALSPGAEAGFEIHISDMLNLGASTGDYDVIAEMKKINTVKPVCIFGEKEADDDKKKFLGRHIQVITVPGGHHYNNNYKGIARLVLQQVD